MRDENKTQRGFTLIELAIVVAILAILSAISLLIVGLYPKRAANEAAAITALRSIVTAQKIFFMTEGRERYGDFPELLEERLIPAPLAGGRQHGYDFVLSSQGDHFTITANPVSTKDGTRSFFADDTGIIRSKEGSGASVSDRPIGG